MVFQNYALYPHMTVADNMGFALKISGMNKDEIRKRVEEAAKILDLEQYLDRKPKALSGGQRQRVAMGRAIVRNPQAFLMDEPLSNLDAKLRVQTRTEIAALQRRLGATTVYVTHDQVEAMTMGDRVCVLKDGYLMQVDTPRNLYDRPDNVFVAGFIGSPAMNLIDVDLDQDGAHLGARVLPLPRRRWRRWPPRLEDRDAGVPAGVGAPGRRGRGLPVRGRRRRGARLRRLRLRHAAHLPLQGGRQAHHAARRRPEAAHEGRDHPHPDQPGRRRTCSRPRPDAGSPATPPPPSSPVEPPRAARPDRPSTPVVPASVLPQLTGQPL